MNLLGEPRSKGIFNPSAWKWNSQKFAFREFSEVTALMKGLGASSTPNP
jgi:hypothetical protein